MSHPSKLELNRLGLEDLLKRRFFFTPSFSIYGGVAGLYDYGPPGCAIKANLLNFWRQHFVLTENMLEVDCSNLTPYQVLKVSGHVDKFQDLMVKDKQNGNCFRADHLLAEALEAKLEKETDEAKKENMKQVLSRVDEYDEKELGQHLKDFDVKSPDTGNEISDPFPFNLMFDTSIGPTGLLKGFLRPETAQGIFMNFGRLLEYNGGKLPFAGATIGTAFRNEIAPRAGLLRVREFTLAEIEHFVAPHDKSHPKFQSVRDFKLTLFPASLQVSTREHLSISIGEAVEKKIVNNETLGYYLFRVNDFLLKSGVKPHGIRFRQHLPKEMAHYACDCWDAELLTSYGWKECVGIADRSAYDLSVHSKATKARLTAYEAFKEPQLRDVLVMKKNQKLIGQTFLKDAGVVNAHLGSMEDIDIVQLRDCLQAGSGKTKWTIGDREFEFTSEMFEFQQVQKKISGMTFIPSVIEPSFGIGRIIWAILEHAYYVREGDEQRGVLALSPIIAPVKCSVLPLIQNEKLAPFVNELVNVLTQAGLSYKTDETGQAIGRKYARTDEIGIPFGVTIDFQTAEDRTVTLRERDSTQQVRINISELASTLQSLCDGRSKWADVLSKYPLFTAAAEAK